MKDKYVEIIFVHLLSFYLYHGGDTMVGIVSAPRILSMRIVVYYEWRDYYYNVMSKSLYLEIP